MADPKDPIRGERDEDRWGIGERSDGSINVMTEDEALRALGQREADEEAFDAEMDGVDQDDFSDLEGKDDE